MSETTSSRNINWEYRNVVFDPQLENVRALETCGPVDVTLGVW